MKILLVLLCLLVATSAIAVPVDLDASNGIAASITTGELYGWVHLKALCVNGEVYRYEVATDGTTHGWIHETSWPTLPVPISEIADWEFYQIKTHSGDLYVSVGSEGVGNTWTLVGGDEIPPIPCSSTVDTSQDNIGNIKSMFR